MTKRSFFFVYQKVVTIAPKWEVWESTKNPTRKPHQVDMYFILKVLIKELICLVIIF